MKVRFPEQPERWGPVGKERSVRTDCGHPVGRIGLGTVDVSTIARES